jgi:hypothetical protein
MLTKAVSKNEHQSGKSSSTGNIAKEIQRMEQEDDFSMKKSNVNESK